MFDSLTATLIAGTLSDKAGNRRSFISFGYVIWGITVAAFGFISPSLMESLFGLDYDSAVRCALAAVIIGDCVMTLFGSTANDAAFSAWVTDNTKPSYRGAIESIVSILPLASMLIVVGGFGILVEALDYKTVFLILGIVISLCGVFGVFFIKDSEQLIKNGTLRDMIYGFKPSTVRANPALYLTLIISAVYGIACQTFMPYIIIYMEQYLGFGVIEYSAVFGIAIALGAAINIYLGRLSDKRSKLGMMYIAAGIFSLGLLAMYFVRGISHVWTVILLAAAGLIMISGYIFISSLTGAIIRDNTPKDDTGKLQGVRMIFCVLIPMLAGPAIGNAINRAMNIPLADAGANAMTTSFIPAPEIFLAASLISLCLFPLVYALTRMTKKK